MAERTSISCLLHSLIQTRFTTNCHESIVTVLIWVFFQRVLVQINQNVDMLNTSLCKSIFYFFNEYIVLKLCILLHSNMRFVYCYFSWTFKPSLCRMMCSLRLFSHLSAEGCWSFSVLALNLNMRHVCTTSHLVRKAINIQLKEV